MAELRITRATQEEIGQAMAFIGEHWRADHVLATSRALMDWQHGNPDGSCNYLIARQGDSIQGVLGYIPISRYDAACSPQDMVWLALWKIREECKIAGLGLKMLGALKPLYPNAAFGVSGINPAHPPMYRALGYQSVELRQHYLTHPQKTQNLLRAPASPPNQGNASACEIFASDIETLNLPAATQPHKTPVYFLNRFLRHPFYRYRLFLIGESLLVATRIAAYETSRVLRIVDLAGDTNHIAKSGGFWAQLLEQCDAEYADLWEYGVEPVILRAAGFRLVDKAAGDIVPNYFEPYRASTERIECVMKSAFSLPWLITRADGDQDRPNRL